ncbi:MAG: RNA polymerase factor sigma-54 [bacterium]|nr:RNA polymerase factor sigma-54 [bacterium]
MEQRLVQSPQMIQAMQILQLSALDLQERIEQELIENPFLEVSEPDGADKDAPEAEDPRRKDAEAGESDGLENMLDELERYERDFGDGPRTRIASGEDGDKKYEAMQNAQALPETLPEALLRQIALLNSSERERAILEYLIWSLDARGYLHTTYEILANEVSRDLPEPVSVDEIELAIARLRSVTHAAIAARDLRECLLLQLDERGIDQPLVRSLISEHLGDIESNRLPRIAKATGRSIEDIKAGIESIRTLDPIPGAEYGESVTTVITPDVIVEEIDGEYVVRLDRERTPDLTVSPIYRKMLQQAERGDGVREWVKKRLETARWFIDAVQQRQSTLQRIAEAVFVHQRDFLDRGVSGLRPLRMQEVADEVGVHISTVSRGVSGKYAQTSRGIFPLKFFFTGGTAKATGEVTSQISIKERIRELVQDEDSKKPLSDDQLAAKLEESDGIKIARRTVTKYRKALGIASSSQRRTY